MLEASGAFTAEEVKVALELVDLGLAPGGGGYLFRVAADGAGRALGYACYGAVPMTEGVYDLYWIVVTPSAQGAGVGRALLEAAEVDVRALGGRMVVVETAGKSSYARTRAFYERCGYAEIARIPDFYRPGDDKVVYQKLLAV